MNEAVRRLTAHPAAVFGMTGRGLIREGFDTDLPLFERDSVGRGPTRRVFDLPGEAPRLTTDAVGAHGVWVNSTQVADHQRLLQEAPLARQLLAAFASAA